MDEKTKRKIELANLQKLERVRLKRVYSADSPNSVPTKVQQEFLDDIKTVKLRWVVASNQSGKSSASAREVAWLFNGDHPFFDIKKHWGDSPLTIMILSKKSEIMEVELWQKKIKPLISTNNYKEIRVNGGALGRIENLDNGNTILFQSHNNPDEARKNAQAYTLNYVWLDEMPESAALVSELILRIVSKDGRLAATFTPLVHNLQVKNIVEGADGVLSKKYFFSIYDNPKLQNRMTEVIEMIRQGCSSEEEFNCRVNGVWMGAGKNVSAYRPDIHRVSMPEGYSQKTWRHIAVVDPAASGLAGLTVWAEDPVSGKWYNRLAKKIQGDAPSKLVRIIEDEIVGMNIVSRHCDSNPAGFYKEAAEMKIHYQPVSDKAHRKLALIDRTNEYLLEGKMVLTKEFSQVLEEELLSCVWSEASPGKIVKASSFHTFDTFQYAADALPDIILKVHKPFISFEHSIKAEWEGIKETRQKVFEAQQRKAQMTQQVKINRFQQRFTRNKSRGRGI